MAGYGSQCCHDLGPTRLVGFGQSKDIKKVKKVRPGQKGPCEITKLGNKLYN